jgi:hypothetical protein
MTTTFNACWPVTDDDATLRELIAEATPDLERMVTDAGHEIAGDIAWTTTDTDGLALLAAVDVEPIPRPTDRTTALVEDIEFLLEADPAMTAEAIGRRVGISADGVIAALHPDRGNRPDLRGTLAANGRENGKRQHAEAMSRRRVA